MEALRLELGVPAFGIDFDDKMYPQEAALEKRAVSFEKGCYLGQEVVCMLEIRGHVKRRLVSFVADARVERGAAVTDDAGEEIGKVSSSADSPTIGKPIGLAMIKLAIPDDRREASRGERSDLQFSIELERRGLAPSSSSSGDTLSISSAISRMRPSLPTFK